VLVILYVRKTSTNSEAGVTRLKRALASPRGKKRVGLSVFFVTGTVLCGALRCRAVSYGVRFVCRSVRRTVLVRCRIRTQYTLRPPLGGRRERNERGANSNLWWKCKCMR
jgi:hypothetical protein